LKGTVFAMKRISFSINGRTHEFITSPDTTLLDILRDDLGLIGAKQSCDRKGECGACTVIVNKKTVLACLTKVGTLQGAEVITIEGLGTPENPHFIQEAFALSGAIQCGFCTPGMIMAAKGLLDANPTPTKEDIKKAFRRNLCRCTGYKKIIEAVQLAARFMRGEITPEAVRPKADGQAIGVSHPRPTALAKACGSAHFTADVKLSGALELAVLRSSIPHARIRSIDTSRADQMPGVVGVLTAANIRGTNRLKLQVADRPILCTDTVRYLGDAILAVAAETKAQAEAALEIISVELEPLPVMDSPEASLAESAVPIHEDRPNLCIDQTLVKGDVELGFRNAAAVVAARFTTQLNHMAALEPEATVVYWENEEKEEDAQLIFIGRSINIHNHLRMLQDALGWENMRYIEAFSGGQFGIKIDIISEGIAGAAAIHFKRPVRYVPSLAETFLMTSKRHPFDMQVKLAADAQGYLTAYSNDFLQDKGAYYSSNASFGRALMTLSGSYYIPNVGARGRLVYTNNPWGSAARGAGQPQITFPLECAMDMLAEKLGLDPFEFRFQNILKPGQKNTTGWIMQEWPLAEAMEAIRPHYQRALQEAVTCRQGQVKRGVGLATGSYGVGRAGDSAVVAVELDTDGGISIYAAVADPGEGNDSMLSQITAHHMGIPVCNVRLHTRDSSNTTATGPAAGSRMTFMVGGALIDALEQLKGVMRDIGARTSLDLAAAGKPTRYIGRKKNDDATMDPKTYQGLAFESYIHAAQMIELEVDTATGEVKIIKATTAVDAGTVVNPQNVEGQIEGGVDMGAGFALRENYIAGETRTWTAFKFPTMRTSFDMETVIVQTPRLKGALGATGIGEMCMVATAPAVINAIKNATGVWICNLPATPEKIQAALAALR
jgi:aldehyde oxidoreductase